MELIQKLENQIVRWTKDVPHLPAAGQKWLATNVWWIVLIGVIVAGISLLFAIGAIFGTIALLTAVSTYAYYVPGAAAVTGLTLISGLVGLIFLIAYGILFAMAIQPLKALKKKGWTLLFIGWLINVVSVVVSAVLSFSIFGFIFGIIFGGIAIAISGYFLFEIHGQFSHAAPAKKVTKKA